MKQKLNIDELYKVEVSSVPSPSHHATDLVQVIIKVREENYIPQWVNLRASISSDIFTCDLKYEDLENLEHDPKVESVSISKKLSNTG